MAPIIAWLAWSIRVVSWLMGLIWTSSVVAGTRGGAGAGAGARLRVEDPLARLAEGRVVGVDPLARLAEGRVVGVDPLTR